jgi:MFS family permease
VSDVPLVALRYRDFRLLWLGQLISQAGSQMQFVTINWHVSELTHNDPLALGMIGLVRFAPIVVFSLIGGAAADALDRRRVMIVTQSALALIAAILGAMTLAGRDSLLLIYALLALAAAAFAFDNPARQSLIPKLVSKEHLPNALSLNMIIFQLAQIVGPTLAGLVIAASPQGIALVYVANAFSFLAVIVALLFMRTSGKAEAAQQMNPSALLDGLRFVRRTPIIWSTMLLDFIATFFASSLFLLPIFAKDILHVGARGYGLLSAAPAAGAILAGGVMSLLGRVRRQGKVLLWSVAIYGLATVFFGLSSWFAASFLFLALTGAADTVSTVIRGTIRQLATPDRLRGRMTAVNMVFFMGGPQLGELEAGLAAALLGTQPSVVVGGIGCLVAVALVAARVPRLRQYQGDEGG